MERRAFLESVGGLMVGIAFGDLAAASAVPGAVPAAGKTLARERVDAWLAIGRDGVVTVYTGKVDLGTGVRTALAQMVADELDVAFERVTLVMGDTGLTPDQGQTASSITISSAGMELRRAAATARRVLVARAARRLGVEDGAVTVSDGVFRAGGRSVPIAELVDGPALELKVDPRVALKQPGEYRYVGKSVPRVDIPDKVTGRFTFMQDFRVPGMLHARVVRPASIGAKLQSVDESSVAGVPGFVQVVRRNDFVAVVARNEWAAVQAAKRLAVRWSEWSGLPEQSQLYQAVRAARVVRRETPVRVGDADAALASSTRTVRATYEFPINTHGSIGPACAIADVTAERALVWSPSQATHSLVSELSTVIGMPPARIRIVYLEGSGCYGRNGHEDCTADAALVSLLVGKPVRVQWSREEEHGWDPKSPPLVVDMAGGIDAEGRVASWKTDFYMPQNTGSLDDFPLLAAVHSGVKRRGPYTGSIQQNAPSPYQFAHAATVVHRLEDTPLRPSHLRTPGRMQNTYANEAFMDELAAAAGADPIRFRMRHLADARGVAALAAVARLSGWEQRASPRPAEAGRILRGRGVSYVRYEGVRTYVAAVAEVEVDRTTGRIRVPRFFVAHDCGQIINPDGVRAQIEGSVIQTVSRTLLEEVTFDRSRVTSVDWESYPILRFPDVPEVVIDLIDHPGEPPWGAGEPTVAVIPSAISNAVFDATGVRLRTVPYTPTRVLAALRARARSA